MERLPLDGPQYLETALEHLQAINRDTPAETMRLHCHFALIFLQLGTERSNISPRLTVIQQNSDQS